MGDTAYQMFFIHSGYVEVLCKNGTDALVYLGKGDYFGEIGVLITGVRTVSVRSKSNSVIYYIKKKDLLRLLEEFPYQNDFLKGVGG
jgi:CRP-like cAMP-binding protein